MTSNHRPWLLIARSIAVVALGVVSLPSPAIGCDLPGCETCACGQCDTVSWDYIPGYVANAQRGDFVFHSSPGIQQVILGTLGETWTHSGVFVDNGSQVRHNSLSLDRLASSTGYSLGSIIVGTIFHTSVYCDAWIPTDSLYYGAPGTHTANFVEERDGGDLYWSWNAMLLKPYNELGAILTAWSIADRINTINYYYSLHSWVELFAEPNGNNSEGTPLAATPFSQSPVTFPSALITPAVNAGFSAIRAQAQQMIRNRIICPPLISCDGTVNDLADGLADQVIKCFLTEQYGRCNCYSSNRGWHSETLPDAHSISPSVLLQRLGGTYGPMVAPDRIAGRFVPAFGQCRDRPPPY